MRRLSLPNTILLLFAMIGVQCLLAQVSFQNATFLTAKDGLSETHLNCLLEDADGFIWIGSKNGLNRYDGRSFRHFYGGNAPTDLKGQNIKFISNYDSLHILVGTDAGLARIHIRSFQIEPLVFAAPAQLAARTNHVHQVQCLPSGDIWVATTGGVFLVSPQMEVLQSYFFDEKKVLAASHLQPSRLWVLPDGRVWAVAPLAMQLDRQAILEIDPRKRTMEILEQQPFPDASRFLSLVQVNDSLGLALYERANMSVRVAIFDLRKMQPTEVPCKPFRFGSFMPFFSHPTQGKIGLSTKGLNDYIVLDIEKRQWEYFPLPSPIILESVANTSSGIVLAATSKGLLRTSPVNRLFDAAPAIEQALGSGADNFRVVDMATVGNTAIVGSWDAKLATIDAGSGQVKSLRLASPGKNQTLFSLKTLEDGRLLVASNKGSFWLNPTDGSSGRLEIPNKPSFFDTLTSTHFLDSRGEVWFGFVFFKGLVRYNPQLKTFKHYPFDGQGGNLNFHEISAMAEDQQGNLWIGWQGGGLAKWVRATDSFTPYYPDFNLPHSFRNNITALAAAPDGRIWMGTAGYGLFSFHPDSMRFTNYNRRNGLSNDYINMVEVDCMGKVWAGTKHGLSRLDPSTGHVHSYFEQHGLPSNDILRVKRIGEDDCLLFVGAKGGYRTLNTRQFTGAHLLSNGKIVVHYVSINGKNRPFNPLQKLVLEYDENNIEIAFSSLNLLDGYLNEYAYRFSEKDRIWKPIGQENILRLTGLQGGKYRITIKVCTNGGNCFEQKVLNIDIKKPFWKSPLYYGLLGLLLAIITGVYFKIKMNNIVRIQRLRQKISYDLHDDIGSNLSSIQVLTTLSKNPNVPDEKKAELADKIKDSAAQVAQSLEEIIWNLHPGNDRFEHIQNRLYDIAHEMLEPKGITLHFNMEADFEKLTLGHEHRRELLLLYREALNNAIKYAGCSDVWVELGRHGNQFALSVRDNGNGFDTKAITDGNGLNSMRFRANNLGGQVLIASKIGEGTEVRLVF